MNTAEDIKTLALAVEILLETPARCKSRTVENTLDKDTEKMIHEAAKLCLAKITRALK